MSLRATFGAAGMGWLADVTERIEIAGSLRRDKQDLGDVEDGR